MKIRLSCLLVLIFSCLASAFGGDALPLLSPVFGDHMVLQREKPLRIWGWATPGAAVEVTLAGHTVSTTAAAEGRWDATLPPVSLQKDPLILTVRSGTTAVEVRDVLIGDVYFCSGQSNMAWGLRATDDAAAAEQALAGTDRIRLFTQAGVSAYHPLPLPRGEWKIVTPEVGRDSSAVALYFALEMRRHLDVPIGLIVSAVGGTPAESWISPGALSANGDFDAKLAKINELDRKGGPTHGSFLMHWLDEYDPEGRDGAWAAPDFDDRSWTPVAIPSGFPDAPGDIPSITWFRGEFTIPEGAALKGRLLLGSIHKMDTTYVNGRWTGASSWAENPRNYAVPEGALRPGRNVLAIRVIRSRANGGFLAKAEDLRLELSDGTRIPLAGTWRARLVFETRPPAQPPLDWENYPTMPVVLHHSMVNPFQQLALRAALWYQGEANTERSRQYRRLLPLLVADWRAGFEQRTLPFYAVSLPRFMGRRSDPGSDGWAQLRDAQQQTAATVPGVHIIPTIDLGNPNDIHPHDKLPVGQRLAWEVLTQQFERIDLPRPPRLASFVREGATLRLSFTAPVVLHGVETPDFGGFVVAGADGVWRNARARLEGSAVLVSSPEVAEPVAVRYAFQSNPETPLRGATGLPVQPFRTDDWAWERP